MNNIYKFGFRVLFAVLAVTALFSCNKSVEKKLDAPISQKEFHFEKNNVTIFYSGKIINDSLSFTISIKDKNSGKDISESFVSRTERNILGKSIADQISTKQALLSDNFSLAEITNLVAVMDDMVNAVALNMAGTELKNLGTQGLFMSNSLVKSVYRKVLRHNSFAPSTLINVVSSTNQIVGESTATTNTVYEGFTRELSSFSLAEDLEINVAYFVNYINSNTAYAQEKGFLFVKNILNTYSQTSVSVFQLEQDIIDYTANNPSKFEGPVSNRGLSWPTGSTRGCCGNYSGPCAYYSPICHIHDALCSSCSPRWFCFSGCVPD